MNRNRRLLTIMCMLFIICLLTSCGDLNPSTQKNTTVMDSSAQNMAIDGSKAEEYLKNEVYNSEDINSLVTQTISFQSLPVENESNKSTNITETCMLTEVGEYNGKKIYDVDVAYDYFFAGEDMKYHGGSLFFRIDLSFFKKAQEDDYFRVAYVLSPDRDIYRERIEKVYAADKGIIGDREGFLEWRQSENGKRAIEEVVMSLTESAARTIRDCDWIYLEEGYDRDISKCGGCRYLIGVATKSQLKTFLPELDQLLSNNIIPDNQSIDSDSIIHVYPSGVVRMMLDHIPVGESIH